MDMRPPAFYVGACRSTLLKSYEPKAWLSVVFVLAPILQAFTWVFATACVDETRKPTAAGRNAVSPQRLAVMACGIIAIVRPGQRHARASPDAHEGSRVFRLRATMATESCDGDE